MGYLAQDRALAAHVLSVHKAGRAPRREGVADALPPDILRAYIAEAKQHEPYVPAELTGTHKTQCARPVLASPA